MAKVSTSAYEAYDLGILEKGKDIVIVNKDRQIAVAKAVAKSMADLGYTKPVKRKDVKVLGKQALGMFLVGTDSMEASNFISEHDQKIANKLAYVMAIDLATAFATAICRSLLTTTMSFPFSRIPKS